MCIWSVSESERQCEFCSYFGGCEERVAAVGVRFESDAKKALEAMEEVVPDDLVHPCRHTNVVWARYIVEYYLRSLGYSLSKISRIFHRGSHSSVVKSEREVERMLQFPAYYENEYKIWEKFQENLLKTK